MNQLMVDVAAAACLYPTFYYCIIREILVSGDNFTHSLQLW